MKICRFTELGIERFGQFLDSHTTATPEAFPNAILSGAEFAHPVTPEIEAVIVNPKSRFELAHNLNDLFISGSFSPSLSDKLLWAWLAAAHFEYICPKDKNSKLQPGARERWIPDLTNFRRYYRHLVAGPYTIYRAHVENPERAMVVLCQAPGRPGDVVEQLASRQGIVSSPNVIQVATELFFDQGKKILRRGSSGKGAGSARRLVDVLDQFDLTWDLANVPPQALKEMLPVEFKGH